MYLTAQNVGTLHGHDRRSFGAPIGVLTLDCNAVYLPGSIGNASTLSAPAKYQVIDGVDVDVALSPDAAAHTAQVVAAARELERDGVAFITANCGFMARYQADVQAAVDVPVLLSSLLLVPVLQSMLPRAKKLGVISGGGQSITPEFMESTGIDWDAGRLSIFGVDEAPAFDAAFIECTGSADVPAIQQE